MPEEWDICENRHGGNEESVAANLRISESKANQRAAVLEAIEAAGISGLTCKELATRWGVGMNTISGRFSELKARNMIHKEGRRDGCGVMFVTPRCPF